MQGAFDDLHITTYIKTESWLSQTLLFKIPQLSQPHSQGLSTCCPNKMRDPGKEVATFLDEINILSHQVKKMSDLVAASGFKLQLSLLIALFMVNFSHLHYNVL